MEEISVGDISELVQIIMNFSGEYIFRGQANSQWGLLPALERVVGTENYRTGVKKYEAYSLMTFKKRFELYNKTNFHPASLLSWLSTMQHYGIPTRLLDFTESPYVALYFALEAYNPLSKNDFSLYAINYKEYMNCSIEKIKSIDHSFDETPNSIATHSDASFDQIADLNSDIVWITEPGVYNERIDKQRGCFLISGNIEKSLEEALALSMYSECSMQKILISANLYESIYRLLGKMNLTGKSIYGDMEGLTKSIRMELQFYSNKE